MIPQARRILAQDFPDDVRTWIHHLIIPINQFMANINVMLNKGLTFKDHFNAEIKTIRLTGEDHLTVSHGLKSRPVGVLIIRSDDEVAAPPFIDWMNTENGIKIRRVFGLEPKKNYTLTLLIIGG